MVAPWGTKYHYMSGIHTNVTTVQLPSGQAWYSYLWDNPQNGGNDPVNLCIGAVCGHGFGLEEDGTVSAEAASGNLSYFTVDFSAGRDDDLAILYDIAGYAAAEGLACLGE